MKPEEIYHAYPRHIGKRDAIRAIAKALKRLPQENQILAGLSDECRAEWLQRKVWEYAESPAGQRGMYTPHPSTWFNQGRYLDDPKEWERSENSSTGKSRQVQLAEHNARAIIGAFSGPNANAGLPNEGQAGSRGRSTVLEGSIARKFTAGN